MKVSNPSKLTPSNALGRRKSREDIDSQNPQKKPRPSTPSPTYSRARTSMKITISTQSVQRTKTPLSPSTLPACRINSTPPSRRSRNSFWAGRVSSTISKRYAEYYGITCTLRKLFLSCRQSSRMQRARNSRYG